MRYEGLLTDIPGLLVGHWTNEAARTGCTVVLASEGAVGGVDVRGAAPGTRETDLLRGYHLVDRVHAVVLSGGSAFGLAAADGVMRYLEERGIGFDAGVVKVPIVPAAVIFDLAVGSPSRPDAHSGYAACKAAAKNMRQGRVGAGAGATAGKIRGANRFTDAGLGSAGVLLPDGHRVAALMVVNPLGEVYDLDGSCLCVQGSSGDEIPVSNTIIGVVATDAPLTREEANRIASMAHDGVARVVRPAHTPMDGDTIFALSTAAADKGSAPELMLMLGEAAADVTAKAIVNALKDGG